MRRSQLSMTSGANTSLLWHLPTFAATLALFMGCSSARIPNPDPDPDLIPLVGWTDFSATPRDEIIYVSSSDGSDEDTGLTEELAKETIAAAYALLDNGEADWILLKRGDTFTLPTGMSWMISGPEDPSDGWARLGAYGTGARPVIDCVNSPLCFAAGPGQYATSPFTSVAFTDIHFTQSQRLADGGNTNVFSLAFDLVASEYAGPGKAFRNILFEGCKFSGFQHGITSASDTDRLILYRNIFTEFFRATGTAHGSGVLNSGDNTLLQENIFYRMHDATMESVADWFDQTHSAYLGAEGGSTAIGNITIRAPEGLMQRNAIVFDRNFVALNHFFAVNTGASFGVLPHAGGIAPDVTDSLAINNDSDWIFGNISGPATVARNMLFQTGAIPEDDFALWGNSDGNDGGINVGVHNTTFEDNWLSGTVDHQHDASNTPPHYSGNTFTNNTESVGAITTDIAEYLLAAGIPGTTFDDYGAFLISWEEHDDYTMAHSACAVINFYRAAETTLPPLACEID